MPDQSEKVKTAMSRARAEVGDDLLPRVSHLEGAVQGLADTQKTMREEMRTFSATVFSKLDALSAGRPASMLTVLDVISKSLIPIALAAGAVVYMSQAQHAPAIASAQEKLEFLSYRIDRLERSHRDASGSRIGD